EDQQAARVRDGAHDPVRELGSGEERLLAELRRLVRQAGEEAAERREPGHRERPPGRDRLVAVVLVLRAGVALLADEERVELVVEPHGRGARSAAERRADRLER